MWRLALKGVIAQRLRLALTGLAIVLGVAFVAGTFVFGDTLNRGFDQLFAGVYANTDVVVQGSGAVDEQERPPFPEGLLATVRAVDGVKAAVGTVGGPATLIKADGSVLRTGGGPAMGMSWDSNVDISPMRLREGRGPEAPDEVVIDKASADRGDYHLGQTIKIILPVGTRAYRLVGIAGVVDGSDGFAATTSAFFTFDEAQRVFDKRGKLDEIAIQATPGLSQEDLRTRVAAALPGDLDVQTGTQAQDRQSKDIKDSLSFLTTFLLVFGFIAVFVAAFIIFNTFNITVAQRARQLALLRAVGATGGQVTRMVVGEALLTGAVASVLGLAGGFLVALAIRALFRTAGASLPSAGLQLEPRTVAVGLLVGIGVTVISALVPALRAARLSPMAALRDDVAFATGSRRRRLLLGALVTVIGAGLLAVAFRADGLQQTLVLLGVGALALFVGLAMLAPLVASPVTRVLGAPLVRFAGVPGRLGRDNAMRNPQRTAQTSIALVIGLALVTFVTVFAVSLSASVAQQIKQQFRADLVIFDETGFTGFPPVVGDRIAQLPAAGVVSPVRIGPVLINGDSQVISGVDPAHAGEIFDPDFTAGGWRDLRADTAVIATGFAKEKHLKIGDPITVTYPVGGEHRLTVVGTYDVENFGPVMVPLDRFAAGFPVASDSLLFANVRPGDDLDTFQDQVAGLLERSFPSLSVRNQTEYAQYVEQQVNSLLGVIYALLALAIIIAVFGIVNTLALSVFERTREIGLLRAVGLSSRQARRMVRYEAVLVALLGGLLGVIVGVLFGAIMVAAVNEITVLKVPINRIVVFFVLAGLAGVLAAVWPAGRAAGLDVLGAITHE